LKNIDHNYISSSSELRASKLEIKGKLIVVEGIDGSGKSTQIRLVGKWFKSRLIPVFMTEWNSSELVKEITSKGKKKIGLLLPHLVFYIQLILQIDMSETYFLYYAPGILY
jgi:thymidylate kinase